MIIKGRQILVPLLFLIAIFSCNSGKTEKNKTTTNQLVGTWRLIEYSDFDSLSGKWIHPYGDHPRGYFTYTNSGIVNLNVSAEHPLYISADSAYKKLITLGVLLDNAVGYFGTYTIDSKNASVIHHPKGGPIPWYIGTDQKREFLINKDTLFIGDPTFNIGKRVLLKED